MIRTLFDENRRKEIQRAIEKGRPLPIERRKDTGLPASEDLGVVRDAEILKFIENLKESDASALEKLGIAEKFLKEKVKEAVDRYGVEEFQRVENTVKWKIEDDRGGAKATFTQLDYTIIDLRELYKLMKKWKLQISTQGNAQWDGGLLS